MSSLTQDLSLLGVWGARAESPEAIAARTSQTLDAITVTLGTDGWLTTEDTPFGTDPTAQAEVVRRGFDRDADDVDNPSAGYTFSVLGRGEVTDVLVRVHAGQSFEPRRTTANQLSVKFTPKPGVQLDVGRLDAVLSAVISAWSPAAAAIRDSQLIRLTRGRGSRSAPVSYRTWIRIDPTQLRHSQDGVSVVPEAEGALIVVPDGWAPARVVAAVLDTLQENGITSLPAG